MNRNDPLRMFYVGVLSTLLLLTGCLGFFSDDVIDSVTAEVSDDDFQTLQTTVSDLDTLITSHTTDLLDLKARVAALEAATGPDISGYASEASLDAMEAKVALLESQYDALLQNSGNGGETTNTTSANARPIVDMGFEIGEDIYHPDDITQLSLIYDDAGDAEKSVGLACSVYHPEGESITKIGIDYNHDGITDIDVPFWYDSGLELYHCGDGIADGGDDNNRNHVELSIPVSEFNIIEVDSDDLAYITLGFKAEDTSGDFNWAVGYDSTEVISFESWMGIDFIIYDATEQLSNQPDDDLIMLEFNHLNSDKSVGVGSCWLGYTDTPEYCIQVEIIGLTLNNYCYVGIYGDNSCSISDTDGGSFSGGIELFDYDWIIIQEDTYYYNQLCDVNYNLNGCDLEVRITIYDEYGWVAQLEEMMITIY